MSIRPTIVFRNVNRTIEHAQRVLFQQAVSHTDRNNLSDQKTDSGTDKATEQTPNEANGPRVLPRRSLHSRSFDDQIGGQQVLLAGRLIAKQSAKRVREIAGRG